MIALFFSCISFHAYAQQDPPKEEKEQNENNAPETDGVIPEGDSFVLTGGYYLILVTDSDGAVIYDFSGYYPAGTRIPNPIPDFPLYYRLIIKRTFSPKGIIYPPFYLNYLN